MLVRLTSWHCEAAWEVVDIQNHGVDAWVLNSDSDSVRYHASKDSVVAKWGHWIHQAIETLHFEFERANPTSVLETSLKKGLLKCHFLIKLDRWSSHSDKLIADASTVV